MSRLTDQSLNRFIRLTGFVSGPSPSPRIHHLTASSSPSLSSWDGNPTTSSCDCDWGRSTWGRNPSPSPMDRSPSLGPRGRGASKPSKKSSNCCTMLDDFEGGPDSNNIKMGLPWTNSVDTGAEYVESEPPSLPLLTPARSATGSNFESESESTFRLKRLNGETVYRVRVRVSISVKRS